MKSLLRLLSVVLLLTALLRGEADLPVLKTRESLTVGTETRNYVLSRPAVIDSDAHYPLLIAFHGNRSQVKVWFHEYTEFDQFIAEKKFLIVYPEGPIRWEATATGRDLPFFDALVAQLRKQFPIDQSRIYAVGHSNGASFATYLLYTRPEIVAAVAAHSGIYPPSYHQMAAPAHKAPLYVIWGENDEFSPALSPAVQSCISAFKNEGFAVTTLVLPKWGHSWGGRAHQVEDKILSFFFSNALPRGAVGPPVSK